MKNLKRRVAVIGFIFGTLLFAQFARSSFLPSDFTPDRTIMKIGPSNMDEAQFKSILQNIQRSYEGVVSNLGGKLQITGDWKSETLNAGATQMFGSWKVQITGGLARYPDLTPDGFALIVCHELGHHLGGFAFAKDGNPFGGTWAAAEGQSDYFASQVCARKIWGPESQVNSSFRGKVTGVAKQQCDTAWDRTQEQDLCYRVVAATTSMITTMANLMKKPIPQYDTPDTSTAASTITAHPAVQCRLDTSFQGALCTSPFNEYMIPGKKAPGGPFGLEAERESATNSCTKYSNYNLGLRPACWFKAAL